MVPTVTVCFATVRCKRTRIKEIEAEASATDTREIVVDPLAIGDSFESSRGGIPDLEDTIYDIVYYMSKEEFRQVRRDRDDTRRRFRRLESFVERRLGFRPYFSSTMIITMTITRSGMTPKAIEELVNRRVEEALAAHEATRAANALKAKNQSQNESDSDNGNSSNGNGENGNGGNGNPNENGRGDRLIAREELMKLMTKVYCPRNEVQKMESKLWNLTVKNNDLAVYTQIFQELTMLCTKMVPEEEDQIERYVGGLLDNIQGNVMSAEPTRLQDAIRLANSLMDQKLKGYAIKNAENKKRLEVNQRDNCGQQPPFKRPNVGGQNVMRAYTAGNNKRKPYNRPLPLYNKCKLHHEGPCTMRCGKCNKRVVTYYECGRQGHYRSDCPKLKDQNHGNKAGNKNGVGKARGKAYVLGGGDANPDSNDVKGTFLLNNHYASMIFDSRADRSFVSTTFSTLLDIEGGKVCYLH
nr:hypothetical protein [Tanacetum cinerariifolium]